MYLATVISHFFMGILVRFLIQHFILCILITQIDIACSLLLFKKITAYERKVKS